ncbi:dihydroorotase [Corticibacter populi]|uniref:Dihydroorotase n=1 Tax=Corticibacter populi TaxID=1550736 RepID=A0A3M6QPB6_9BURK|nr:dihydroorotase [Corticibacter populi]RMX04898.1 dihydroorotase [Corticibacter populi]RZS33679.1 dihydroorotase [Corticibacter populi]
MKTLIQGGRIIDPASGLDTIGSIAIASGRIVGIGSLPADFAPDRQIDANGLWVLPGLVDLCARLGEPGYEHAGLLETEMHAAAAGGVTSVVCPPDTAPILDEAGLVEMLKFRAANLRQSRLFPLGALTRGLKGEVLTELAHLTHAGCIGFSQADVALRDNQVLQRALQYASTFGYSVWLRPQDHALGKGVAASSPLAQRLGLSGVPVAAETIALHTIFELLRSAPCHVHLCRLSSAQGVELVRQARAEGLPVTCDVSINSLFLTDLDIGFFDSRARLNPPLRQQRDREALAAALADGTIDALVSDHTPVDDDAKTMPFAEAAPGATGLELLLALAHKWSDDAQVPLARAIAAVTSGAAQVAGEALGTLRASVGRLVQGGVADLCLYDPAASWVVGPDALQSSGKQTPFEGYELPGRVRATLVAGEVAFERAAQPAPQPAHP